MEKLEIGTRIRITKIPQGYWPYYRVGSEGVAHHYDEDGDLLVEFDEKFMYGLWYVVDDGDTEYEIVNESRLTHAEYYEKYGQLTDARIRDLLAVYGAQNTPAKKPEYTPSEEMQNLIARVREIDESAADYLEGGEWLSLHDARERANLASCFVWGDSPQGHGYWDSIAIKLGEWI